MLTPFNTRFTFIWYWLGGAMCAYLALFAWVQKNSVIPSYVPYTLTGLAGLLMAIGFVKVKKWLLNEDVLQRGASMLIQAKTGTPELVHSELKKALGSKEFISSFEKGVADSKWTIHNDTSLQHAQVRVEFNFPETWMDTPSLWCALGIIVGTLPEGYKWGSTGREQTKIVLTVKSPDGTSRTARLLANNWIQVIRNTVCKGLQLNEIDESYEAAAVPELKGKAHTDSILMKPPAGDWTIMASLPKEQIVIRISAADGNGEYKVIVADKNNSRTDIFKNWPAVLQIWGNFPEVKTAILEKFKAFSK